MSWGSWAVASLMLAAGANDPDITHLNQTNFDIPVKFGETRQKEIREIILYYSTDLGKTWNQAGVTTPDKGVFPFIAHNDGMYWFSVVAVDQFGKRQPEDIYKVPPSQKVLVDTRLPELRILGAERQADEVVVRWSLIEENPDYASFKLEYRPTGNAAVNWSPVTITQPASGQAVFRPLVAGPLTVKLTVQDLSGNQTTASAEVQAGGAGIAPVSGNATMAGAMPLPPPPIPPTGGATGTGSGFPPLPQPAMGAPAGGQPWSPIHDASISRTKDIGGPDTTGMPTMASGGSGSALVASSGPAPSIGAPPTMAPAAGARGARGFQAPLQYVNTPRVTLQYQIARLGASGISSVELYATRDDGRTWQLFGGEKNLNLPMPADARAAGTPLQRGLTVDLPEDGVYGFYLVVKSGVGLGKRPPQSGETPEMRIELDTKAPEVELFAPEPDPMQRDALLLTWNIKQNETNLTEKPVTLEWAERKGGPWNVIGGSDMVHAGRFSWHVTGDVPARVYLRITARDKAGNVGVAESSQPIAVDLNEPEVKFIGLGPVGR